MISTDISKYDSMPQTLAVDGQERTRVMTLAVVRAAEKLGLSERDLATILGISELDVSRMRKDEFRLKEGSKAFEMGALLVRLFRSLYAITGGDELVAHAWLRNNNRALVGCPLDEIKTITGMTHVVESFFLVNSEHNDPALALFLNFLAADPQSLRPLDTKLMADVRTLTQGVELGDTNATLNPEDD